MLYFPDEGHWVLKPQNSQLWYKTVNGWVDQWLKTSTQHSRVSTQPDRRGVRVGHRLLETIADIARDGDRP